MEKALLLATVLLPAAGAILVLGNRAMPRRSALVTTLFTLALAAVLIAQFPGGSGAYAVVEFPWLGSASSVDIRFSLGLDGLGL